MALHTGLLNVEPKAQQHIGRTIQHYYGLLFVIRHSSVSSILSDCCEQALPWSLDGFRGRRHPL